MDKSPCWQFMRNTFKPNFFDMYNNILGTQKLAKIYLLEKIRRMQILRNLSFPTEPIVEPLVSLFKMGGYSRMHGIQFKIQVYFT
jgi:hypothetical protein